VRLPALSPLGERVARPGVFSSRGGPGEGVARPFAAHDSPLKAMGNDHATSSAFSRNLGTALRGFWFHAIDPLTPIGARISHSTLLGELVVQ